MTDQKKHFTEKCEQIARQELENRGWGLVQDWNSFMEEVINEAERRLEQRRRRLPEKKIISNATVNRYGHLWHKACGADGTLWQHQAFEELDRYLYRIAVQMCKNTDIAEDSAQEAQINVWRHLSNVRDPGTFPRWAGMIVTREVLKLLGKEQPGKEETDEPTATHTKHPAISDGIQEESTMSPEMREEVEEVIDECLRSQGQKAVMIGLLLEEKSVSKVAEALHKTVHAVHGLKRRALQKLKECQKLLTFFKNLGMSTKRDAS